MRLMLPIPVARALRKLGQDIQLARRRRRISAQAMADRAGVSRMTLHNIEKGKPGVSLANYACVLFVLGLVHRLSELADAVHDKLGQDLEDDLLPKRVREKRRDG